MNDHRLQTRRFPRTLNEAFGPYSGTRYHAVEKRENPLWWVAGVALLVVLMVLVFSQA